MHLVVVAREVSKVGTVRFGLIGGVVCVARVFCTHRNGGTRDIMYVVPGVTSHQSLELLVHVAWVGAM